jgi:outer membrane protein, heavy metal efflux system
MGKNSFLAFLFAAAFFASLCSAALAQPPAAQDTASLRALLDEALASNPRIAEARSLWRAAEHRVPRAGALDDPMLGFALDEQPFEGGLTGTREISLSQAVPFPGKRGSSSETAALEAAAKRELALQTARDVVTEVKIAYIDLFMMESQLAALRASRDAAADAEGAARARYETGLGGQQDLLIAMVEKGQIESQILRKDALVVAGRSRLNLLLARDGGAPLGRAWIDSLSPFNAAREELVARARAQRPSIRAKERESAAAESAQESARIESRPDFALGAGYMQRPAAPDEWRAEASMTLPLWKGRKQDADARAADERFLAAESALEAERDRVAQSVEEQYAHVTSERAIAELYRREILPQADLAYRSARAGYLADREEFLVMITTLRRRIEIEKEYYELFANAEMHLALLEQSVGADLGGISLDLEAALEADARDAQEGTDQ